MGYPIRFVNSVISSFINNNPALQLMDIIKMGVLKINDFAWKTRNIQNY